MEILGRCVVRTRRANHIEPLESQLGLKLAQHIDLTGDTDQSQSAKTSACAYWNKASKRMHRIRVRTCSISAVSMMRPGYGFRRSFASGDTATIVPFSSNSAPQPVVILIHYAPFTGSAIRTRCIHWTGPKTAPLWLRASTIPGKCGWKNWQVVLHADGSAMCDTPKSVHRLRGTRSPNFK